MEDGVMAVLEKRRTAQMGDHGTIINIVSWMLAAISLCTLIARFAMKFSIKDRTRRFGLDDTFILFAALFSLGQTIAVSIEAIQAIGQHMNQLSPNQLRIFQKAEYAGCMLYIANMGCARISLCILIKKILPGNTANCTVMVFACFTALWTLSGVFVTAFPCRLPNPWQFDPDKKCIDIIKWVNYVGITNIVVEVLLVSIPLCVWNLRTSAGRRVSVSLVFIARLSIVAAIAAELNQFNRFTSEKDYTYGYWRSSLCVQIAQNLSIITACLPCLHPFIIKILGGTIKTEAIKFTGPGRRRFSQVFVCKESKSSFDAMSSQSSTLPFKEPTDYCRPLVTHGLDRSSAHLNSQHFNRFPTNVATPIHGADPPENVFMRSVEFPNASRPPTSHESHNFHPRSSKALPEIPKTLADVGVIPMPDWETDSGSSDGRNTDSRNSDRESGSSSPSRRPNSEYVFNRSKVISVPEESHLRDEDGQYYKKYYPPLPSPGMPKRPPRI